MKELKKGEWIRCADEDDMKKLFKALAEEGYNAVRLSPNSHVVVITGITGEKHENKSR